ncbi:hypothetical protein BU52_23705, partial [Streptomyces toyocaensis]
MREFIVEADGGSRGNPGPAGYGAVVSDAATGETLTETAEYLGVATNNVAEYRGLLAGLRAARALDPRARVHVRMDSKLVIEQMTGRWKIKHPAMKPLAAQAADVFPPERVTYEWIPRERNKHADRLANEAMDAGKRGGTWSPTTSRADLDTPAARPVTPEASGPPGDARAGAARVRAALTSSAGAADSRPEGSDTEPVTAAAPVDAGPRAARDTAGAGAHGAGADADVPATGAGAGWEGAPARGTAGAGARRAAADADVLPAREPGPGAGVDRAGAVAPD